MVKKQIVWFEEVGKHDVGLVGGKGANLGEMTRAQFPIPYGFVVTSHAYFEFVKIHSLDRKIESMLKTINYESPNELHEASKNIKELFQQHEIQKELTKEIIERYEQLILKEKEYFSRGNKFLNKLTHTLKSVYKQPLVAVRSSATAEDLPDASFAGQQETYLNVQGDHHLIQKVKECWASLFTERAIYYRHEKGFDHFKVGLAAVVQRMVESEKSGISFSIDPLTNDKTKIVVEAIFGLGEYIVGGKVTPDHYEIDKRSLILLKKEPKYQNLKYIKVGKENKEIKLSKAEGSKLKLSDDEILRVAMHVRDIEKHYFFPQDIEWAIENDKVFIVQSRPITTIKNEALNMEHGTGNDVLSSKFHVLLTGAPASPGIGVGPVTIIQSPKEIEKIKKGDILVAPSTNPDYVPAMRKAAAIVTEHGGRTSHAAIVSRELGIPAVVGADGATKVLKNGEIISVDGKSGEVYKGSILSKRHPELDSGSHGMPKQVRHDIKTKTKVYVNLAEPENAEKISKMDVDGVGLLRAEFMIASIGTHPKEYIKNKKEKVFVDRLVNDLHMFVKAFNPRPIIYRATDFKTNEYRHLKGGEKFEPKEENPMLGFRGASRYIKDPEVFALELTAIRRIWDMGYKNLHLMIPFVRVPWELSRVKEIVSEQGLLDMEGFKFLIMVEVPACALWLSEFLDIGVDGVSIGTNDLTMMLLGVDRDNEAVSSVYDERNPVVLNTLKSIVTTCKKYGVTSSICGQAASDYPQIVEMLIREGITSVSVNSDTISHTRELIHLIEKQI